MHTSIGIYTSCGYPKQYEWALIAYAFSHVLLFGNFYYHSYVKNKQRKTQQNGSHLNGHANGTHKKQK
jgi:hypothetical protein